MCCDERTHGQCLTARAKRLQVIPVIESLILSVGSVLCPRRTLLHVDFRCEGGRRTYRKFYDASYISHFQQQDVKAAVLYKTLH